MKRWLPFPVLSALLFVSWLALAREVSVAHGLLALIFAVGLPKVCHEFLDHLPRLVAPLKALRFLLLVAWDIVIANMAVARLVLGPMGRLRPAFVTVPLDVTNPQSIALLASIITMTPGTVSAELAPDRRSLIVHVLDCPDADQLIANIKARYERPLMEIFR